MSEPRHPGRTTVLVGLVLALLLAVACAVVSVTSAPRAPGPEPLPALPAVPSPTPVRAVPEAGADYPVRKLGAFATDKSVLLNGQGNAELRYRRAPHNGTRLHFICSGCDTDSWLVELPRGAAVDGGALPDPADVTSAVDVVAPGGTSGLLVKAPAGARWTVTLTPFDAVPVHEETFAALGDDVVAVRAHDDLRLTCGAAASVRTLARAARTQDYEVVQVRQEADPGTWPVTAPTASDPVVLAVSCPGRWTVTVG